MKIVLDKNDHIDVTVEGRTVRVAHDTDGDDNAFVHLGGVDCNLAGEQPGMYYLEPLALPVAPTEKDVAVALLTLWKMEGGECSHGVGFDVDCHYDDDHGPCEHNEVRPMLRHALTVLEAS